MGGITTITNKVKYIGIASLTIAILSILILNIISSYSSNNIESNAIDSNNELSTSANDSSICDPTNTNAEACISLSITSSSSSTGGNDPNLSLSIPQGGGIATGRHTVEVSSNSYAGWSVSLTSKNGETDLVNNSNSKYTIPTLPSTATVDKATTLANNTYGVAFPYGDWITKNSYNKEADYLSTDQAVLSTTRWTSLASLTKAIGIIAGSDVPTSATSPGTRNIYYGVRIDNPTSFPAGDYSTSVVYTATALLPPTPNNLSVNPTTFEFDSCNNSLITIEGANLSSAYEVYLQKSSATDESNRLECTNLDVESNAKLTCNIPTSRDEVELNTTYDIYVISQAANPGVLKNAFTYTEPATGLSVKSDNENIIVDYDTNMIPIKYVGYDGNGGGHWAVVTDAEIEQNTSNWFRYDTTEKKWANAITVTAEAREAYRKKQTGEDPDPTILPSNNPTGNGEANPEILGYWVYIPRYAYEVQRRDAIDAPVDPQNFDIVFQTASEKNTPAPTKSTTTNHLDYRNSGISRTYAANSSNTTWATHPAFTWGDTELNGIWVGKYETTGKISAPTVKPNQHANISEYVGTFYTASKSIGKEDKCNVGGNTISGIAQDSHNLQTTKSHMLKNSEWGAITYLAHSKYGAGINTSISYDTNVQRNSAYPSSSADADGTSSRFGITGCGPNSNGGRSIYTDGAALSADVIESPTACSQDPTRAYNGSLGILSSTTNTIYGVYGLSGGAGEYVMGNRTTSASLQTTSSTTYFETPAESPYVDLYVAAPNGPFGTKPSWSSGSTEQYYNYDVCTFETCGGAATYETTTVQSVSSYNQSWGGTYSIFVHSSSPWFYRGSNSDTSYASPFYTNRSGGYNNTSYGSRAALLALPAGQ